jgi:hypothetical protein
MFMATSAQRNQAQDAPSFCKVAFCAKKRATFLAKCQIFSKISRRLKTWGASRFAAAVYRTPLARLAKAFGRVGLGRFALACASG